MTLPRLTAAPRVDRLDPSFDVRHGSVMDLGSDDHPMYVPAIRVDHPSYGASPNAASDWNAGALQAAIAKAEDEGGGTLVFARSGVYRTDTMLQVESAGISFIGSGVPQIGGLQAGSHAGVSTIKADAAIDACLILESGKFYARNMVFDANDTATHAFIVNSAGRSRFDACVFTQATADGCLVDHEYGAPGVTGGNNNFLIFDQCQFSENGAAGCYVKKGAANNNNAIRFDWCNARTNVTDGLIVGGTNTHISGGNYSYNTGYGIRLGLAADPQSFDTTIFPSPYIEGNTAGGILQDDHTRCLIIGVATGFTQDIDRSAASSIIQLRPNSGVASGQLDIILGDTDTTIYRFDTSGIKVLSDQTDEDLILVPKGAGGILFGSTTGPGWYKGSGTPEGAVTARIGSIFSRTDGGAGTSLYVKESGTGNTGWVAK